MTSAAVPAASPSALPLFTAYPDEPSWSVTRRAAFRFAFVYLALYYAPFPIDVFPDEGWLSDHYDVPQRAVVLWIARHVFRATAQIATGEASGSGDTLYDYYRVAALAFIALVVAAVWSAVDRQRPNYARLAGFLRFDVRYALGATLISYGVAKVIKTQFPDATPDRLLEPLGEFSPMGLVWTFMGYSAPYNLFTGSAEVAAGLLMFFRRTTTLGALLAMAVMGNVVLLNFSYDVPVKLYSSHLFASAAFLALPDVRRLCNVLVLNRGTRPAPARRPFEQAWAERARPFVKGAFIVVTVFTMFRNDWKYRSETQQHIAEAPLYGVWEVDSFARNGVDAPPLTTDKTRWRRFFQSERGVVVRAMDDTKVTYRNDASAPAGTLALTAWKDKSDTAALTYVRTGDTLRLEGKQRNDTITVTLHRIDPATFLLVNRGFHWVNEFPLNR